MTNYNDKFTQLAADLAQCIRRRKFDEGIRFAYGGAAYDVADRAVRIRLIDRMTYDYMTAHSTYNQRAIERWKDGGYKGERPATVSANTALLQRLADAILDEELTDTYRGKSLCVEYPFLSERQLTTRHDGECSLKLADDVGLDGRNYAMPHRRKRKGYENRYVDNRAKIRNKARAAQYRRETAAGPVTPYNLRDTGGVLADEFVSCRGIGDTWRRIIDQSEYVRDGNSEVNA